MYFSPGSVGIVGVEKPVPAICLGAGRQCELHHVVVGVEHDKKGCVLAPPLDPADLCASVQKHAETAGEFVVPGLGRHLRSVRVDPGYILDVDVRIYLAGEKPGSAQDRIKMEQRREAPKKLDQRQLLFVQLPVRPADLVVLAIGVVVAVLSAAEFIAGAHHRRTLREQERCEKIAHLPPAESPDFGVVARAFGAAVPRAIVRLAVAVVLAVRLVVLVVVRNQVAKGEAVVSDDEIDACPGLSAAKIEFVG